MPAHLHYLTALAAAAALAACSAPAGREEPVHEVRTTAAAPAGATTEDPAEWSEARGGLLRNFAFRALERNLLEEGRRYLAQACEADPTDGDSHAALARLYLAEGDAGAALVYAERASACRPDDPAVSMVYAAALAENQRPEEATAALEHAWTAVETDPEFARSVLLHFAALGESGRAKDFVTRRMEEDPQRASSWAAAGDLLLAEGDLEGAAASYKRALELDSTVSTPASLDERIGRASRTEDPVASAARAAEEAGNTAEAENLYRFLVGKDPTSYPARLGLARCLAEQQRWSEAETQLAQVPYGVRGWRGHLLQARLDVRAERWGAGRAALLMALQERPGLKAAELLLQHVESRLEAKPPVGD
jgi:Tfp pilus assembly protein PilF